MANVRGEYFVHDGQRSVWATSHYGVVVLTFIVLPLSFVLPFHSLSFLRVLLPFLYPPSRAPHPRPTVPHSFVYVIACVATLAGSSSRRFRYCPSLISSLDCERRVRLRQLDFYALRASFQQSSRLRRCLNKKESSKYHFLVTSLIPRRWFYLRQVSLTFHLRRNAAWADAASFDSTSIVAGATQLAYLEEEQFCCFART